MDVEKLQKLIISEYDSDVAQQSYIKHAEGGLWSSEEKLISEYFDAGSRILDVGCGTGRTTLILDQMGYDVVGIDISPQMIKSANKIAEQKSQKIDFQVGDATNMEFANDTFDHALFSNQGWTQIPSVAKRQKAIDEVFRVLKPGGIYIFSAHPREWNNKFVFFWIWAWFRFHILKPIGVSIWEEKFGDRMYIRESSNLKYETGQYIHIPRTEEVISAIVKTDFKLMWHGRFSRTPVFFVCRKPSVS